MNRKRKRRSLDSARNLDGQETWESREHVGNESRPERVLAGDRDSEAGSLAGSERQEQRLPRAPGGPWKAHEHM